MFALKNDYWYNDTIVHYTVGIYQPDLDIQRLKCKGNVFNRAGQDLNHSLSDTGYMQKS